MNRTKFGFYTKGNTFDKAGNADSLQRFQTLCSNISVTMPGHVCVCCLRAHSLATIAVPHKLTHIEWASESFTTGIHVVHVQSLEKRGNVLMTHSSITLRNTLNTSLTAVISSGPTPSPGTMVTLKVVSARAGGASGDHMAAETLSGLKASCCLAGPLRP